MSNSGSWNNMKIAKEESFFKKQNDEAIKRIQNRQKERLSPVSKEPLTQETIHGIVVDLCKSSGGVWLDAGELEQIITNVKNDETTNDISYAESFIRALQKARS